jgi:TldD protein
MSAFLKLKKPAVKALADALGKDFAYASVLGTDVTGKTYSVRDKAASAADCSWAERGFVARVYNDGAYFEYSFNEISEDAVPELARKIKSAAGAAAGSGAKAVKYPLITEEAIVKSFLGEVKIPPGALTSGEKIARLKALNAKAHEFSDMIADFITVATATHVSKIFISGKKDLEQSYIWSEAYMVAAVRRDNLVKTSSAGFSGMKGLEILDEMEAEIEKTLKNATALLDAGPMPPGEYEVVCGPQAVGIIAHEAFGHGVEMDMFVKNRAKSVEYLGKPVASGIVTMRDGAASAVHVSSYMFDDEGTLGTDTVIIENGTLKTGISDLLSALKLGTVPTGNGKRESFEHKAYSRMTNTFFQPGGDKLADMIASVKHGYFIERTASGMEDPKDWGIQVMFESAEEIKDGKLTGKIVAPVIMTGYVPDLLKNITMTSDDFELEGAGACGKGYKEWVKVSTGGPYIKTKARLG